MNTTGVPFMQFKASRQRAMNIGTMLAFVAAVIFSCTHSCVRTG